jgi:hypothetical protein
MSHSLVVSSMTDEDETAITAESELFCKEGVVRIQKTGHGVNVTIDVKN